ncbi:DNA-binding MarR family transcriptional regulator [Amorphus suaedae]
MTYKQPLTTSRDDFLDNGSDVTFREAIYTLVLSVDQLLKCRDAFARALGLTSSQFAVLMGVASQQKSQGVAIKVLAEHVSLASTHVTTEVGRLERKGLLLKQGLEADRRMVLVSLTPAGEQAIDRIAPLVRDVNDLLFQNVSPSALSRAHRVARTIVANSPEALELARKHARAAEAKPAPRRRTNAAQDARSSEI